MRDAVFGWWGHLPVFTNGSSPLNKATDLGEHVAWHEDQLKTAFQAANQCCVEPLKVIPSSGFFILALRTRIGELSTGVLVCEDTGGLTYPSKYTPGENFAGIVEHRPLESLGGEENCFLPLFPEVSLQLPQQWASHLKWRKRQPWRPVPEWLIKLRTEELRAKRRNRRTKRKIKPMIEARIESLVEAPSQSL